MGLNKRIRTPIYAALVVVIATAIGITARVGANVWLWFVLLAFLQLPAALFLLRTIRATEMDHFENLIALALYVSIGFQSFNASLCILVFPSSWLKSSFLALLCYFLAASLVQFHDFAKPTIHSRMYAWLITFPSTACFTSALLSILTLPFLPLMTIRTAQQVCVLLPYVIACVFGTWHSLSDDHWTRVEVDLATRPDDSADADSSKPVRADNRTRRIRIANLQAPSSSNKKTLTVVQLTDFHLGHFYTPERLYDTCKTILSLNPDLICLTGDYFTPEGDHTKEALLQGLSPLSSHKAVYACLGNHDRESSRVLRIVETELKQLGIKLLVDEVERVSTRIGNVDICGLDWRPGAVEQHILRVYDRLGMYERSKDVSLTVSLLHDPQGFQFLPHYGSPSITLSGHTHGGQVGLLSLGLPYTLVGLVTGVPDQGLWQCNYNYLYVHRGQGFRSLASNFLARVGVPNENSIMEINL